MWSWPSPWASCPSAHGISNDVRGRRARGGPLPLRGEGQGGGSTMSGRAGMATAAVPLIVLASAVPWLQTRIDSTLGEFRPQEEVLYLWSGKHVKMIAPGFEGIAA